MVQIEWENTGKAPSQPQPQYQQPYAPQQPKPFCKNPMMWVLTILILLSLILSISSLFLPWYYVRININEVEDVEGHGLLDMEDKLDEREEYLEVEVLGQKMKDTEKTDNDELRHEYPDTANCKNITRVLVIAQIILLIVGIIIIGMLFYRPQYTSVGVVFVLATLIISILLLSYFTLGYGPYKGDTEEESELDVDIDESGNWFYRELKYSGDIVGEGKGGVSSGYVVSFISIICLILALIFSIVLRKAFKRIYYLYQPQSPQQTPYPQYPYPPQQPPYPPR